MSDKIVNAIREKVEEYKKSMNPKVPFLITSDDKILFVSPPLIKILKRDPSGTSFITFIHPNERSATRESLDKIENGDFTRTIQLGTQTISVNFKTTRELIDGRVIGLTIVTNITILTNS